MNEHEFYFKEIEKAVNDYLLNLVPETIAKDLKEAILYSLMAGGKRLRPLIIVSVADIFNVPRKNSLRVASAIEMVHCYSLIHDDLPCMDDDDYRRGQLSCHKKYGEAKAILAGDALLTLAFEIISDKLTSDNIGIRADLVSVLAKNAGINGIVGGQSLDIEFEKNPNISSSDLFDIHMLKTAKLFVASASMAGLLAIETNSEHSQYFDDIKKFGLNFGLGFQILDDLDDKAMDEKDKKNNLALHIGSDKCKALLKEYRDKAITGLKKIPGDLESLEFLVASMLSY